MSTVGAARSPHPPPSGPNIPGAERPASFNPLFGRQPERARVAELIGRADVRLVTLTGPGGVGKTRLALQIVEDLSARYPDGQEVIHLWSITDPVNVLSATANVLALPITAPDALFSSVVRAIDDRRMLLLFDNFEHVVDAATLIVRLLDSCPNLDVLATSRIALRVSGEFEIDIAPLPAPVALDRPTLSDIAANPAVALFMRRAQAIQPNLHLDEHNAGTIAAICARVDGLPLAIELAASRSKVLPPEALLKRLDHRLDLLTSGPRDLPARQQTMRSAIAWSHDLLGARERAFFRRFAVFAGGGTLEAVEIVCGPGSLDTLETLIDHSLIQRGENSDGAARFSMLETIREFASAELAASDDDHDARKRLSLWCLRLSGFAFERHNRGTTNGWIARLDQEMDNLRAALTWLQNGGPAEIERGLRIVSTLWQAWHSRSPHEGRVWLDRLLASPHAASVDPATLGNAWMTRGSLEVFQFDLASAAGSLERALTIAREAGDRRTEGRAYTYLCANFIRMNDLASARDCAERGIVISREVDDRPIIASLLGLLGRIDCLSGTGDHALRLSDEGVAMHRALDHGWGVAWSLENWSTIARLRGEWARALEARRESIAIFRAFRDSWWLAEGVTNVVILVSGHFEPELVGRVIGLAEHLRELVDAPIPSYISAEYASAVAAAHVALGPDAFERARSLGRGCTSDEGFALIDSCTATTARDQPAQLKRQPMANELTQREIDVLRLVAAGLTNAQVAERLFLSPRTIGAHLQRIYAKLGVTTRTGAVQAVADMTFGSVELQHERAASRGHLPKGVPHR